MMSDHWTLCYHYGAAAFSCHSYFAFVNKHNRPPFHALIPPCRRPYNRHDYCISKRRVRCSFDSNPRGFGLPENNDEKGNQEEKRVASRRRRKSASQQSGTVSSQAPGLNFQTDGKSKNISADLQFEERLQAVRRSAIEQKRAEEENEYGVIDYDAPVVPEQSTIGLGTKIGVGVAVVVFGLVFTLGDFIPSGSVNPTDEVVVNNNELSNEEKANLQTGLQQFEATLNTSPEDPVALEGAAVTLSELGEYARAASLLENLTKKKPSDPDVFRLLGEIKYKIKDYEGSAAAYTNSMKVSENVEFEVLRGLTNALLASKKPDEAVHFLLASRERLSTEKINSDNAMPGTVYNEAKLLVDPVQVELLLGKAYSDWGHVSDAVSVYDQLISSHPNDFRGYLAKGIILKENGNTGDAERMFIQAHFFAPDKAKALVDRYSRQ